MWYGEQLYLPDDSFFAYTRSKASAHHVRPRSATGSCSSHQNLLSSTTKKKKNSSTKQQLAWIKKQKKKKKLWRIQSRNKVEEEINDGTFYHIDEEFAACVHCRLQQWAKNKRRAKCHNIQSILICILQGCLFSHNLGNSIPIPTLLANSVSDQQVSSLSLS